MDVTYGSITCYISDTVWKTTSSDYEWVINTRGYADIFIDPAEFGRLDTRYIFVTVYANYPYVYNTYTLNSTSGNFSSQGNIKLCYKEYH